MTVTLAGVRPAPFTLSDPVPAPRPGCRCLVCAWAVLTAAPRPIRPTDPAWPVLLRVAEAWEETRR